MFGFCFFSSWTDRSKEPKCPVRQRRENIRTDGRTDGGGGQSESCRSDLDLSGVNMQQSSGTTRFMIKCCFFFSINGFLTCSDYKWGYCVWRVWIIEFLVQTIVYSWEFTVNTIIFGLHTWKMTWKSTFFPLSLNIMGVIIKYKAVSSHVVSSSVSSLCIKQNHPHMMW